MRICPGVATPGRRPGRPAAPPHQPAPHLSSSTAAASSTAAEGPLLLTPLRNGEPNRPKILKQVRLLQPPRPKPPLPQLQACSAEPTTFSIQQPTARVPLPHCALLWLLLTTLPYSPQSLQKLPSHVFRELACWGQAKGTKTSCPLSSENCGQSAWRFWKSPRPSLGCQGNGK